LSLHTLNLLRSLTDSTQLEKAVPTVDEWSTGYTVKCLWRRWKHFLETIHSHKSRADGGKLSRVST